MSIPVKAHPFKSLIAGLLMSICLAFFFHFGILLVYNFLPESVLLLFVLTVSCFLVFWINIKYDQMNDFIDVISKTVAFNFRPARPGLINSLSRLLRPVNPYIGAFGTISGLLFLLWAVPAIIIYWSTNPGPPGMLLKIPVFVITAASCIWYFFLCKDQFTTTADKVMFFAGISLGPLGVFKILS